MASLTDNFPELSRAQRAGATVRGTLLEVPNVLRRAKDTAVTGALNAALVPAQFASGLLGYNPAESSAPTANLPPLAPVVPVAPATPGGVDNRFAIPEFAPEAIPAQAAAPSTRIWGPEQKGISMGPDPRLSMQRSEARQAAADRGDWDAVNASYGPGGLSGREPAAATGPRMQIIGGGETLGDLISRRVAGNTQDKILARADTQARTALLGMQVAQQGRNYASEAKAREATAQNYEREAAARVATEARQVAKSPYEIELLKAQAGQIAGSAKTAGLIESGTTTAYSDLNLPVETTKTWSRYNPATGTMDPVKLPATAAKAPLPPKADLKLGQNYPGYGTWTGTGFRAQ